MTKLKAFADDRINVAKMMISVFDRVENIMVFSPFPTKFSKGFCLGSEFKVGIVWQRIKCY